MKKDKTRREKEEREEWRSERGSEAGTPLLKWDPHLAGGEKEKPNHMAPVWDMNLVCAVVVCFEGPVGEAPRDLLCNTMIWNELFDVMS
jgi:hypothetical protein